MRKVKKKVVTLIRWGTLCRKKYIVDKSLINEEFREGQESPKTK